MGEPNLGATIMVILCYILILDFYIFSPLLCDISSSNRVAGGSAVSCRMQTRGLEIDFMLQCLYTL